ncbi:katanin p80 WD40 repeat-containing subunit B1 [Eupeodes corollae]|uniref:katanin p80 WD40 repeat-containing subunit B1 n=1 Tax=Eupeodes corollae TaxID=290404 RepID=UPI0024902BF2|nr:katanin p80 WD40 repeat-containing subunit B1 [Eupeodes corollae]
MALPRKLTKKIYEIKAHSGKVTSLDLGETGRVLVTGGQDRNVNLWAIGEEKCFMSLTGHNGSIDCVKFAYNDDFVYSADDIGIIRRWDLNAQTICSTLNGHMESVRTLDFNPSGEYVISGSNDTTVRLWDVRNQNKCIKVYRGHIAHVNSVKFSPDGLWIASAGTEGSVILWDIRKSKLIMDFTEKEPSVTCIQFHPFEFLLAVGRIDGTISIYDLESQIRISKTDTTTPFSGYPIKCITFSENGECLFVGTSVGISVIGWEPDREFDNIESMWHAMGDMKIVNRKLLCGSYEQDYVAIHALTIDRVIPFYNPSNSPFSHNQTTRKSFSRGHQKLRLSIGGPKQTRLVEENEERSPSLDGQSSPNLSLELVDDMEDTPSAPNSNGVSVHFDLYGPGQKVNPYIFPSISSETTSYSSGGYEGPSSLKMPGERDVYKFNRIVDMHANEIEYNLNDSNPPIISNYNGSELVEDFPVNSAQNYSNNVQKTAKSKTTSHVQKRTSQIAISNKSSNFQSRSKLSNVSSVSTTDLHKIDDNVVMKKSSSSTISAKVKREADFNKENAKNKNIAARKAPTRSKTSLDLRPQPIPSQTHSQKISSNATTEMNNSQSISIYTNNVQRMHNNRIDDSLEIQMLASSHEEVYQELNNRHATLQLIRNSTRSHDIVGALKQAIKMNGRTVFVDLLGAILEKTSSWNLDLCLLLLPEIYELLQSQHKFHYTRACDTLRVILSNFLPIIQDNIDPWSASGLGVDVTREERTRKCIECQHWLQRIRNISEPPQHIGSTLSQLQNMIVNI